MNQKLKILHLEDTPSDAELVERILIKSELIFDKRVVANRPDFEKALDDFAPDIVLSDHSLPSFDSIGALNLLKAKKINIPFILITATISEDFAVEIMKQGAADYILKDRMQRLPNAIVSVVEKWKAEVERKKVRDKLIEREEQLELFIEHSPAALAMFDTEMRYIVASRRWISDYKIEERQLVGRIHYEIFPGISQEWKDSHQRGLKGTIEKKEEDLFIGADGIKNWIRWEIRPWHKASGEIGGIIIFTEFITERKEAEENLKRSEAKLKEAQAIAKTGNWEIDFVRNEQTWSDGLYEIYGVKKEDVQPSTELFMSFMHPEDVDVAQKEVQGTFETLKPSSFNFRFIRKDHEVRYGHAEARFELDANRNPIRLYGIVQDITEQKIAEEEKEKMIGEIIQRNKDLEQFSYIISHNLRAPVANIIGYSNAFTNLEMNESEKKELLNGLSNSVTRLDNVIKDLNHILKVKREITERKEMVHFSELVADIKISIGSMIQRQGFSIKTDFSAIDEFITLKGYLYSIFYNLISNSIKYCKPGTMAMLEITSEKKGDKIILTFKDNGLGIDLAKKGDQVFGLYKRFHTDMEGKGMGLFMTKTQVETLGGKINLDSEVDKGTKFIIEFPL